MAEPRLVFGDNLTKHKKGCKVCCCDCAEGKKKGAASEKHCMGRAEMVGLDPRMLNVPNELSNAKVNELLAAELELYCKA